MLTMIAVAAVAVLIAYAQGYKTDRIVGFGISGLAIGAILFGGQAMLAAQPKVPCWTQVHGVAQLMRAMPFVCQDRT